jgi:GNAT superfamily N-acetyltransferase
MTLQNSQRLFPVSCQANALFFICLPLLTIIDPITDDKWKQETLTSNIHLETAVAKMQRKMRNQHKHQRERSVVRAVAEYPPDYFDAPPTYEPKIPLFLRPAARSDVPSIACIYNHYVLNSVIPEDQYVLSDAEFFHVYDGLLEQGMPFIVAISGFPPSTGHKGLPITGEKIIGFANTEPYACGMLGSAKGRSRLNVRINFYVDPEYTRKGVGLCLADRLLDLITPHHALRDLCPWFVSVKDSIHYTKAVFKRENYLLVIEYPFDPKETVVSTKMREWIRQRLRFEETFVFVSMARTRKGDPNAKFLDVALFTCTAAHVSVFNSGT